MKIFKVDLDRESVDLFCFIIAAALVVLAQFRPDVNEKLYEFALLSGGSAFRGLGTERKNNDYEDGDRQ